MKTIEWKKWKNLKFCSFFTSFPCSSLQSLSKFYSPYSACILLDFTPFLSFTKCFFSLLSLFSFEYLFSICYWNFLDSSSNLYQVHFSILWYRLVLTRTMSSVIPHIPQNVIGRDRLAPTTTMSSIVPDTPKFQLGSSVLAKSTVWKGSYRHSTLKSV